VSCDVVLENIFNELFKLISGLQINIQRVPELADQIETVYSLMVMKVKNV
jgi:hypothetical protein